MEQRPRNFTPKGFQRPGSEARKVENGRVGVGWESGS